MRFKALQKLAIATLVFHAVSSKPAGKIKIMIWPFKVLIITFVTRNVILVTPLLIK